VSALIHVDKKDTNMSWVLAHDDRIRGSKKFWEIDTVALSFVFDKYCPIMD